MQLIQNAIYPEVDLLLQMSLQEFGLEVRVWFFENFLVRYEKFYTKLTFFNQRLLS